MVHCNRMISFLSAKYRVRQLDKATLRVQARSLMERAGVRAYWASFRAFREDEAMDGIGRSFNSIFDDEYTAVTDEAEDPVAA